MLDTAVLTTEPAVITLDPLEIAQCDQVVKDLLARFPHPAGPEFLRAAGIAGHTLPARLRQFLLDMRFQETTAACIVSGLPVDDTLIGPTPHRWGRQDDPASTAAEETWLVLCGSVLGELFGWATQQAGALVHDIAPIQADEHSQVGSSSTELLWWHTEEAFHPFKCDYLGLLCLRNDDRVPTTFSSIGSVELDPDVRKVLFEERFVIRPDDSHLEDHDEPWLPGKEGELLLAARRRMEQMNSNPRRVALLSGDPDAPYLSIDPYYMDVPAEDVEARKAFEQLCAAIDANLTDVVVAPGEILFVDNYRAVHGRKPFQAAYDGRDRWLKRINVTRDLRKSRAQRLACDSPIIY